MWVDYWVGGGQRVCCPPPPPPPPPLKLLGGLAPSSYAYTIEKSGKTENGRVAFPGSVPNTFKDHIEELRPLLE